MTDLRAGAVFAEALAAGDAALQVSAVYAEALGGAPATLRASGAFAEALGAATAFLRCGAVYLEVLASSGAAPLHPLPPAASIEGATIIGVEFDVFDGSAIQTLRLSNAGPAIANR